MDDIAFPRGGRPSAAKAMIDEKEERQQLKRRERPSEIKKKRKAEKESPDFLFGSKAATSESKSSTMKSKKTKIGHGSTSLVTPTKHSLLPLGGGGVYIPQHNNSKSNDVKKDEKKGMAPVIEALSFQKLSKGTKLLGYVREVQDEFAVISLPNLLTGFMLLSSVVQKTVNLDSPTFTSLKQCLAVGQILTVAVQKVAKEELPGGATKKRIQVSAMPTHVNPRDSINTNINNTNSISSTIPIRGQILSVEDHGCLVDLGMGRRGFLKFDQVEGDYILMEADEEQKEVDPEHPPKGRILQPGRLYDFFIMNQTSIHKKEAKTTPAILPLRLSKVSTLSQQIVMPQATLPGGRNKPSSTTGPSFTLSSLQPGMMVTTKVEAIAKNGLCVTFLGNVFRGAIELGSHMGGHELGVMDNDESKNTMKSNGSLKQELEHAWRKIFDHHQHFPARIIAVDVPTKMIRLSIAPHILTMKPPPKVEVDVGTIVKECTVVRVDQGIGVLLALPKEYHLTPESLLPKRLVKKSDLFQNETFQKSMAVPAVYVHISKAYDEGGKGKKEKQKDKTKFLHETNVVNFTKDFGLGSKHSVRILNTGNWVDGIASGGCSRSVLEAHVLTHADLQPGQLYKQVPVCAKLTGGSILVNLGGSQDNPVRGLIPSPLHLMDKPAKETSDFHKKVLETKFAVDAKVDVRVLWVDHRRKRCVVTAKKSLVKVEDHQIVTSYDKLVLGRVATGYVSKVDDRGLYVTFCDRVYGRVTAKSLAFELGIENHLENYQVGDVVTCRVVKMTKSNGKRRDSVEENDGDSVDEDEFEEQNGRAFYQVLLSLKINGDAMNDDDDEMEVMHEQIEASEPKSVRVRAGAVLPEKSLKIVELFKGKPKTAGFVPGYAIVSIKSKYLLDDADTSSMLPQMECKLPFDQLLDDYEPTDIASPEALDALAARTLRVGKKINQKAIVLTDPGKTNVDHSSGIGRLTVVSLRKGLIAAIEGGAGGDTELVLLPSPSSSLFVGALVKGYVAQIDPRHGAFLRFLDGMTGLIPRMNGGLDLMPYSTIVAKVQVIDDTVRPYRVMLYPVTGTRRKEVEGTSPFKVGDFIAKAQVTAVHFLEARLSVVGDAEVDLSNVSVRLHASMKAAKDTKIKLLKTKIERGQISIGHPFYGLNPDDELENLRVVAVEKANGKVVVQVTDRHMHGDDKTSHEPALEVIKRSQLKPGITVSVFVSQVHDKNKGLTVWVNPSVKGFIPGLELTTDPNVLNSISRYVPLGAKLTCVVMDDSQWHENRAKIPFASRTQKSWLERKSTLEDKRELYLSVLAVNEPTLAIEKPVRSDLIIGRINKQLPQYMGPSLMLTLRGGFLARCCITELAECDDWENMPLGRSSNADSNGETKKTADANDKSEDESTESDVVEDAGTQTDDQFADGRYVLCRVLKSIPKQSLVEISLRESRLEGDLDDDDVPSEGETVQAYVIETNKKGCFVRLARQIEGRATLTELCDGFLPNPHASFPPGRLVVGKIKGISSIAKSKSSKHPARFKADLDMRESTLLGSKKTLAFEDVVLNEKYKGTISRIESYGVFVQLENSKVSGLVHLSECSDSFVKDLASLYDPGDLVKVLVIKKDTEKKLGFSMKASHFEDDSDDSDDAMEVEETVETYSDLDSDDENFASNLASKMAVEDSDDSGSSEAEIGSESESDDEDLGTKHTMDTDAGFDWGFDGIDKPKVEPNDSESSDSSESEEDEDTAKNNSHKSRKKQAQRRREEQEIAKREAALADGTADENPETAADFERLLAGSPNSSELWIRYMAFHLSVADVPAARLVAEKAIDRIEFREEREKLNVWTAFLTIEHKYGTEGSLKVAIERACGQNNPKQVYLRTCEILEKDLSTTSSVEKADAMYQKMCAKFKSKKRVWLAYLTYLLKQSRTEEAHALLKRALLSLAPYKHAETMSKFAQLEYEFGRPERARTLFDGLVSKYPKRLDLFYVYIDKEIKFGSFTTARTLLQNKVNGAKLSDKQVKGLFKKWFQMEEQHGDVDSMEHVKNCARQYVQKTSEPN